ncbi:hypothetical protein Cgig2_028520 [Carnegiea gigantea]|uniref:Reverse transcriptase zinc-binding domain-containing protein n=1 Tax=Carnegiea gigantea TaxID=171969 RepID=A0A9Q1GM21_9CARY|nr:hypothetical protein Cgig2_028520 [Carnegiea gigantea]
MQKLCLANTDFKEVIPRHSSTTWILAHGRLPTRVRLNQHIPQGIMLCELCHQEEEDENHLFTECPLAKSVWLELRSWWHIPLPSTEEGNLLFPLVKLKAPKDHRLISYAVFSAGIYNIWHARNMAIFKKQQVPSQQLVCSIKTQIRYRILVMNKISHKYKDYIDRSLL